MTDTEHQEWLRAEEERGQARARLSGKQQVPDDEVKRPDAEIDEAQEDVDDAADDAVDEQAAEDLAGERDVGNN